MSQGWAPLPAPPAAPQAYYGGAPPPPPQKPSGIYKALGIVQMALGAVGVLYALFSIASTGFVLAYFRGTVSSLMDPFTLAVSFGRAAAAIVTGAMLVATGVGVFRAKRWSRPLGVSYAALSLLATWGGTAIQFFVVQPRVWGRMGVAVPHEFTIVSIVSALVGALVATALPVVTLVMLLRRAARAELDQ